MNGPDLDPKFAHLPLQTQRAIASRKRAEEEEARKERERDQRIERKRAEIAAKREAEAARRSALEERRRVRERWETPFVMTSAAGVVFGAIERCIRFGHNGLIVGAPGVGKTRTLLEAVRRSDALEGPAVALVTVTGSMGNSAMALFDDIAPHLGVKPAYSISATLKRLSREACFAPVMLFDDAQNLSLRALRDILSISEAAHIQMIFLGNDEVLKIINSKQAAIQQIARRLPVREEIPCILDTDADLIASRYDVEGMEAFRLCRELARVHHADGLGKILPVARAVAEEAESKVVRLDHLREALSTFPHFVRDLEAADAAPKVERLSSFKRLPNRR